MHVYSLPLNCIHVPEMKTLTLLLLKGWISMLVTVKSLKLRPLLTLSKVVLKDQFWKTPKEPLKRVILNVENEGSNKLHLQTRILIVDLSLSWVVLTAELYFIQRSFTYMYVSENIIYFHSRMALAEWNEPKTPKNEPYELHVL